MGRRQWKKESGYHRQGTVENAFLRYKSILGDRLHTTTPSTEEQLAPAASWRSDIVPAPVHRRPSCGGGVALSLHRYSFAELMKRVFRIDALKCATCGSGRRWIAAHNSTAEASGEVIGKILASPRAAHPGDRAISTARAATGGV